MVSGQAWIKILFQVCVYLLSPLPPVSPVTSAHGACPMWGQKEVSTQQARCWIGCYFSRPTTPNLAQDGVWALWGQDMQVWGRGQNFLYLIHLQVDHQ